MGIWDDIIGTVKDVWSDPLSRLVKDPLNRAMAGETEEATRAMLGYPVAVSVRGVKEVGEALKRALYTGYTSPEDALLLASLALPTLSRRQADPFRSIGKMGVSFSEAEAADEALRSKVGAWIRERGPRPRISAVYRGVPKGVTGETKGYLHGTPWLSTAARGGKGAFGDSSAYDVFAYPYRKDTLFYRGGSLAGDPLERTRIHSIQGMTWDELLDRAKLKYQEDLLRRRKRFPEDEDWIMERVLRDFENASFEMDLRDKVGIWRGKFVPEELRKDYPKLRSYEDLENLVDLRRKQGFSEADISEMPEMSILRRRLMEDLI